MAMDGCCGALDCSGIRCADGLWQLATRPSQSTSQQTTVRLGLWSVQLGNGTIPVHNLTVFGRKIVRRQILASECECLNYVDNAIVCFGLAARTPDCPSKNQGVRSSCRITVAKSLFRSPPPRPRPCGLSRRRVLRSRNSWLRLFSPVSILLGNERRAYRRYSALIRARNFRKEVPRFPITAIPRSSSVILYNCLWSLHCEESRRARTQQTLLSCAACAHLDLGVLDSARPSHRRPVRARP